MSLREEDRQKNNCPSRGLGLAAAAIGVGVGAALYYFFSKRPENPDSEGSTQEWQCEEPQNLFQYGYSEHSDGESYTTISEHSTSDTSILNDTQSSFNFNINTDSDSDSSDISLDESLTSVISSERSSQGTVMSIDSSSPISVLQSPISRSSLNDSDVSVEWDVTTSSLDVPSDRRELIGTPINRFISSLVYTPRRQQPAEHQYLKELRAQKFRERSWSLEECSICFELILKDQEVMALSCAHNFHTTCLLPWLQQQQTCPNCRKAVD